MSGVRADVRANGLRLSYLTWGAPRGAPIVLLHGAGGQGSVFRRLAAAMPDRRVIALDQRGFGESDWASVYGSRPMVADLAGFVDELGLDRFDLLGMSMGGINAIAYAGQHPTRVGRLVVVDIGPRLSATAVARVRAARPPESRDAVWPRFADHDEAFALWSASSPSTRPDLLREDLVMNLVPADGGGFTFKWDKALRDGSAARDDYAVDDLWGFWEAIAAPTLLVVGEDSDLVDDETMTEMRARLPSMEVMTVFGAGHNLSIDEPDVFADAVGGFVTKP